MIADPVQGGFDPERPAPGRADGRSVLRCRAGQANRLGVGDGRTCRRRRPDTKRGTALNARPWAAWSARAGMSPVVDHIGGCFDDLPEGTAGAHVVDAPGVVRALFLEHAE